MDKQPAFFVIAILFFLAALSLYGFYSILHPPKLVTDVTPAKFGLSYEDVNLTVNNHLTLRGWFIPANNPHAPAIILTHGYGGDKGDILASRLFLHKKYNLLFFDFRYFGKSDGDHSTAGIEEVADLEAAINYLHMRGISHIAVWGLSMGAAVALVDANKNNAIRAIIAEASYARLSLLASDYFAIPLLRYPLGWLLRCWAYLYLGFDIDSVTPEMVSTKLNIPVFYMHSKSDSVIPYKHLQILQKAASNNPAAIYYLYDQEMHGELPSDYQRKINDFLGKAFDAR